MNVKTSLSLLLLLLSPFFFGECLAQQAPINEIRAAWLTTNWGLDWPTQNTSVEFQKKELVKILDEMKAAKINVILFQARAQGAVFYNSKYQPKSSFFNHADNFDPLAFAIEECHKRGMECHAWLITFPVEKQKTTGKGKRKKIIKETRPDNYKLFEERWYLDPGHPDTQKQLVNIVDELVSNYDIDGIHFDYIRYPSNTQEFPDKDTYKLYGKGKSLHDWRRDNINNIVTAIYDKTKSIKKWVQVSSSPLGRYRVLPEVNRNDGWTARETVFQDAGRWMQEGKHDLVFPMMYYRKQNFEPFLIDWIANSGGRHIVAGIGLYQMQSDEQNWKLDDITAQLKFARENKIGGLAFFRINNIRNNMKGIRDTLGVFYNTEAKLPPLTWLSTEKPSSPIEIRAYRDSTETLHMEWDGDSSMMYNIYFSLDNECDINNPYTLLEARVKGNKYSFGYTVGDFGYYYTVTASDRYHNESDPCYPVYFVHSKEEH